MKGLFKTRIREVENGHQVSFTIGCQTFFLQPQTKEQLGKERTTLEHSKWYEEQLKTALNKLVIQHKTKDEQPECNGWYNTDRGKLYWFPKEQEWSCRNDRVSAEYPEYWYSKY